MKYKIVIIFIFLMISLLHVNGQKVLLKIDSLEFNQDSPIVSKLSVDVANKIFEDVNVKKLVKRFPQLRNKAYKLGKYKMLNITFEVKDDKLFLSSFDNQFPEESLDKKCINELMNIAFGGGKNYFCEFISYSLSYEWGASPVVCSKPVEKARHCIENSNLSLRGCTRRFIGTHSVLKGIVTRKKFMDTSKFSKNFGYFDNQEHINNLVKQLNFILENGNFKIAEDVFAVVIDFEIDTTGSIANYSSFSIIDDNLRKVLTSFIENKIKFVVSYDLQGINTNTVRFIIDFRSGKVRDMFYVYRNFRETTFDNIAVPIGHI